MLTLRLKIRRCLKGEKVTKREEKTRLTLKELYAWICMLKILHALISQLFLLGDIG